MRIKIKILQTGQELRNIIMILINKEDSRTHGKETKNIREKKN